MTTPRIQEIQSHLTEQAKQAYPHFQHLTKVTSTNDALLKISQEISTNAICITDSQISGRGRRGQSWISNPNDICFSVLRHTELSLEKLSGISLVTGVAIIEALEHFEIASALQLKWPNDIFCNNKKLGGVLIETTRHNNMSAVIIGIGLNKDLDERKQNLPYHACCLDEISQSSINRDAVIAHIINKLTSHFSQFEKHGLEPFKDSWKQYDLTYGREIAVTVNSETTTGVSHGINENGDLILISGENETIVHSGSISIPSD